MTIAQKLAWKRFGINMLQTMAVVVVAVLTVPGAAERLGIPATIAAVVVSTINALVKLNKENGRGMDIPEDHFMGEGE